MTQETKAFFDQVVSLREKHLLSEEDYEIVCFAIATTELTGIRGPMAQAARLQWVLPVPESWEAM